MQTEITNLVETLSATDPHGGSWAWNAAPDDDQPDAYIDCSQRYSKPGVYGLEVGDGEDVVRLDLSLSDLREIHKQLTVQLMIARMREPA